MAVKRERQLLRLDAAAVINHPDEGDTTLVGLDADAPGAGIEGIFDELFDDGGGSLDHFTGGDAGCYFGREDANGQVGLF